MRSNMLVIVTNQYAFLNEKMGISLDTLFQKADKVTEECILNDQVQQSLKAKPLEEVEKNSLSKYFAYINLDHVSEYCYVDNKQNLYTRSYSKIPYADFSESGFLTRLGDSYADTVWFVAEDTLFGTGKEALFIGRKVHSLDYAHEPGYLFLKMDSEFLDSIKEGGDSFTGEAAMGVMDGGGNICDSWFPASFSLTESTKRLLADYAVEEKKRCCAAGRKSGGGNAFPV